MTETPWPAPADRASAERLIERLDDAAFAAHRPALEAIGGGSPYLSDLMVRERAVAAQTLTDGPDLALDDAFAALDALSPGASRTALASGLRAAKRKVALICALADIGGAWQLGRVTGALSRLAEVAVGKAIDHLLLASAASGELDLPDPDDPGRESGLIVLGMGKLGAGELNYSSDIDLVLFFDPAAHPGRDAVGATFTRLAKNLVAILEARDANGYVFRTDLRLRPARRPRPPSSRCRPRSPIMRAWGRTGSARP